MNTILLATDGSPSAELAAGRAIDLARATGWPLRIVVAWKTPVIASMGYTGITVLPELTEAEREQAATVARTTVARARKAGVDASFEIRQGDPADEICAAAEETGATLIVLGTHGWGSIKRLLLGSVSTRVLHEAPCAVLVVRPTEACADVAERPAA